MAGAARSADVAAETEAMCSSVGGGCGGLRRSQPICSPRLLSVMDSGDSTRQTFQPAIAWLSRSDGSVFNWEWNWASVGGIEICDGVW